MFYENRSLEQQESYKKYLAMIGSLSNLFSESKDPALYYRAHENLFCKCFEALNLARHDCSADASIERIGIGLKTWTGSDVQKVAEFGKLRKEFDGLTDDELVIKVAGYRNDRIETTMNMYGLDKMIYHVVIRKDGKMKICECPFDKIDIKNIKRLPKKDGANTRYFTDGKHTYNFNMAKTTLYMLFDDLEVVDEIPVDILEDPFERLDALFALKVDDSANGEVSHFMTSKPKNRRLAVRLYKETKNGCVVEEKSGLNIWNAGGRARHPNEVYIPYNKVDRDRPENADFFPPRDTPFELTLPDGKVLSAKICQENGKAIMSNPNRDLGQWLLRDVLNLPEGTIVTYEMLQEKGFDTVVFEKLGEGKYKVDFTGTAMYNELYHIKNEDED